jgi:hypothetical protein
MTLDLAVADKIKQLRRAGLRPAERLVQQILQAGAAAVSPLIALAIEIDLMHDDEPGCFAPLHALRLLGELRAAEMIQPLLREFPLELYYQDEQLPRTWSGEATQMIARIGAPAADALWAIADDPDWHVDGRGAALSALVSATVVAPELREPLVAGVRERLARCDDRKLAAHFVFTLGNLGVAEVYGEVMALYRQGRIDTDVAPPGMTRQLLLTKEGEKRLECVKHSLWERYDLHGPFPEEEAEV